MRHPHFTHADHERMKATLDSLPMYPTEEQAEAALQVCGTSGREVVNEFIERLLQENTALRKRNDTLTQRQQDDTAIFERMARSIGMSWCCTAETMELEARISRLKQREVNVWNVAREAAFDIIGLENPDVDRVQGIIAKYFTATTTKAS